MNIILFEKLSQINSLSLHDNRAKHIKAILKLGPGDTFRAGIINGRAGIGCVIKLDSDELVFSWAQGSVSPLKLDLLQKEKNYKEKNYKGKAQDIILALGYCRPICMQRILREASSLGVAGIIVIGTDLGEKSYRSAGLWQKNRYRTFLIDGAQQAGVTTLPYLLQYQSVDTLLESEKFATLYDSKLVLDLNLDTTDINKQNLLGSNVQQFVKTADTVLAFVGSERGWSDRERQLFNKKGIVSMSLGTRVLRTETACGAAVTLLLAASEKM